MDVVRQNLWGVHYSTACLAALRCTGVFSIGARRVAGRAAGTDAVELQGFGMGAKADSPPSSALS